MSRTWNESENWSQATRSSNARLSKARLSKARQSVRRENKRDQIQEDLSLDLEAHFAFSNRVQHNTKLTNKTKLLTLLASVGALGVIFFSILMERSLAPVRESSQAGFSSFGDMFIIPGFLCFGLLLYFSLRGLFTIYRELNDPTAYRSKANRRRRS